MGGGIGRLIHTTPLLSVSLSDLLLFAGPMGAMGATGATGATGAMRTWGSGGECEECNGHGIRWDPGKRRSEDLETGT